MDYNRLKQILDWYIEFTSIGDKLFGIIEENILDKTEYCYEAILKELFYNWFPQLEKFKEESYRSLISYGYNGEVPWDIGEEVYTEEIYIDSFIKYWSKKLNSSTLDF